MRAIEGILFEPVGCLAEFPAEPFLEIASRLFGRKKKPSSSASRAYWHLLSLAERTNRKLDESVVDLELQAVAGASVYEDVLPALSELKAMGVNLFLTSSLSGTATTRFLEACSNRGLFSAVWNRDNAGGIKTAPLQRAISGASISPEQAMFLADTAEGLKVAKSVGVHGVLMMNDPDEARRLALHNPAGGIVSLHELPDFVRLVAS